MSIFPFQAGGSLLADSAVYISRKADEKAATHLRRMEYITLVEPRQHGKTSLINRLIGQFSPQGYAFAYRDLMAAKSSAASPADWYASLGKWLLRQLRFMPRDQRPKLPTDSASWEDFLAGVAEYAQAADQNVVIVLDEIGAMPAAWATDFFSIIRSVYTSRQNLAFWQHLTFIIAGAFNPNKLIQDKDISKFNVDQRIPLDDFNLPQVKQLAACLSLPRDLTEAVAERVYYWTDGQPYLCQWLCLHLAEQQKPITMVAVDDAVERFFCEDTYHLSRIKDLIAEPDLLAYTRRITSEPRVRFSAAVNDKHFRLAHIIGVIKADHDRHCKIRNRIYERAIQEADEMLNEPSFAELHKESSVSLVPLLDSPPPRPSSGTTYHITITGDGNVVGDGSGAQVIHREPSSAPEIVPPPGVSVTLLTRIFPTAYCHNLIAKAFPLVTITLDNTGRGCDNAQVSAEAVVQGYSEPAVASLLVPRGQQAQVALLPMLRHKAMSTLNEIRPASLRVTIHQHHASRSQLLHDHTYPLHLHARDTALLAVKAPDGSTVDLTDYLVAWVTPRRPEIERLLRQAVEYHPDRQFVGYQGASKLTEAEVVVREQARAIFAVLKQDANLVYINSPLLNLGTQDGQVTQRVRLPTESLAAGSSANCIDGTVLFASLLELASIEPLIVLVPRHAFVGWRIWSGVDRYEFLETTMIGNADFDAAQKSAQARYEDVLLKGYLSRGLFDPGGFARLIDVAACRKKGIHPLE